MFGRPDLDSEYLEPRNDVEETLVEIWQELLGVNEVGVQDSFFDLGGHSLIAVRLFARVKKMFSVEFPISVLFEAPTIEACAALISEAMSDPSTVPTSTSTVVGRTPAVHPPRRHAPGRGRSEAPFFLVAGMFGNVLNLRHLAHQIGADRPFYGVQARGLYGGEVPHEDFVEMATRLPRRRCARCSRTGRTSSAASPAAASPPSRWRSSSEPKARRSGCSFCSTPQRRSILRCGSPSGCTSSWTTYVTAVRPTSRTGR